MITLENHNVERMNCEVLEVLSDITISSTQKIMTLIIRDENNKVVVSQQKWWRLVDSDPWSPGKGFQVNGRMAVRMGKALQEAGSKIITIK